MKLKKAKRLLNKRDKVRRDAIKTLQEYLLTLAKEAAASSTGES